MDLMTFSPEAGLWGFFVSSFLAATLLPGGSEVVLLALLTVHPEQFWSALLLGTLGNTLGGLTSYACGRWLPRRQNAQTLPHLANVQRYGPAALLLAWVPLIGDALCVAAGWLRMNAGCCALFMAAGKCARYALIAQSVT